LATKRFKVKTRMATRLCGFLLFGVQKRTLQFGYGSVTMPP
jgi:hypothetical protein